MCQFQLLDAHEQQLKEPNETTEVRIPIIQSNKILTNDGQNQMNPELNIILINDCARIYELYSEILNTTYLLFLNSTDNNLFSTIESNCLFRPMNSKNLIKISELEISHHNFPKHDNHTEVQSQPDIVIFKIDNLTKNSPELVSLANADTLLEFYATLLNTLKNSIPHNSNVDDEFLPNQYQPYHQQLLLMIKILLTKIELDQILTPNKILNLRHSSGQKNNNCQNLKLSIPSPFANGNNSRRRRSSMVFGTSNSENNNNDGLLIANSSHSSISVKTEKRKIFKRGSSDIGYIFMDNKRKRTTINQGVCIGKLNYNSSLISSSFSGGPTLPSFMS